MTLNQRTGAILGSVYVLVGLLGFALTDATGFAAAEGDLLLGIFEVNPLHNVVHLLVGTTLVTGAVAGAAASRIVNLTVGGVYLLVGVVGAVLPADSPANILALNVSDHFLHLASALVLLGVGIYGTRKATADHTVAAPVRERVSR